MGSIFALFGFVLQMYTLVLLARVFMSWIPELDPSNPIVRFIYDITEPVLRPVRQALPPTSGFDLSPLVVMLVIWVIQMVLRV